jgi:sulfite exporter TauE/SafE
LGLLGLGFILGLRHALDADHIAAVSTIVSETRKVKSSSLVGIMWGMGHTTSLLIAGLIILLFKVTIPPPLSTFLELCVGILLVALGVSVFVRLLRARIHIHIHFHNKKPHIHFHSHSETVSHHHSHYTKKSFFIGMLHGLAGSAALMLLVLASATSILQGVLYIAVFGIGSIISMLLISTAIGLPFSLGLKLEKTRSIASFTAASISVILGFMIVIENMAFF